jgi:hypothetical protein
VVVDDDGLVLLLVAPLVFVLESALLGSFVWLAFAALLESSFDGGRLGALLLAGAALLLAAELLSGEGGGPASALLFALLFCCGGAGGCGAVELFGVFWLTRFPKRSLADGVLARVSHEGAVWNAALAEAAASGVALTTGRPPTKELIRWSARTGPAKGPINMLLFQLLMAPPCFLEADLGPILSARRQVLPSQIRNAAMIASRACGLY